MSTIGRRRSHARSEATPGYNERRLRLLEAASDVFREQGFQGASVADIAERFGGDRASVYYYYASKHEIFIDLIRRSVEEVVALAEQAAVSDAPPAERLREFVRATLEAYERHYPYMFVYIQEDMRKVPGDGTTAGEELRALGQRYDDALEKIINDGRASGGFRDDLDPVMLRFAAIGALNWTHRWYAPGGRLPGGRVGEAFADIFLEGIRAQ